ncbi:DNA topoisomerase 2 isoform X2 [Selaginella moellendorffii]|uniref:DNA topoisomerase 2 isoform X2 n=1 Tax=Selaginella moellendorffii TaxID=88036 RepID=UPI000D1D00C4|nr:DNA topoisomerase 2 isoform X2 [Selaginella moellendorffii]|eukprot:XP_002972906.2 DNA topoisomerase 2 isoform X2 [Selaginella moellendorffii]
MGRPGAAAAGGKTIEEIYQKKTPLEHVLLRPDTYVGSIEKHTQTLWVYEGGQLVNRAVTYVPGLYKIFDEILVNAADNKQRDPIMDAVKVTISVEQNTISVYNNGDGVPVEVHNEQGVYVPEMIFGHLLTSSNYDDNEKKTTGGRNGYGAKLANIFSTEFVIETADGKRGKKYKQVFSNNMSAKSEPAISSCKSNENWTKVTFKPDLAKFHMTYLEEDVVALMSKRVLDIAGCLGRTVKVELNGQKLPVKTFSDYVGLYLASAQKGKEETLPRIYERANDRWEVCVSLSDGQFQQVSFVNSIATIRGGTHVQHVSEQIVSHIQEIVNKKNKNANVKGFQIRNHLWVFVNSLIDNPAFDSQTKETLTTRQTSFGSKCELSPEFLKKVSKCGVVDNVLSWADFKQSKELKKNDGAKRQRLTGIAKLDDANDAGGKNSEACTLILTEGDSAKALAMSGISVVGRNHYGVFPLRGKLLNVREATHKQIMDNAEITSIKQILGLQQGKGYENTKSLRYGHLMIMTDQDHDGSHIKGLIINFIHTFWPSLLKVPGFLVEFITPIVKATHKNGKVLSFYTMPEYESWKESLRGETKGWSIKYYKGLGTSTAKEGKEYFRDLVKHKKDFAWDNDEDGDSIELAFSKKKTEARKIWLRGYQPGTFLDQTQRVITYSDFINKELILFSLADLARSVPSMVDGLKPGQRKILFAAFKRNFTSQAKVAQFSGYVSEHSAYHHGEQSLASTIIGMAQNFVGSNNINILAPIGQFGTRSQGGKDHASARYIYTSLTPLTRTIFPKPDDILLNFLREDGQSIEPFWYAPILPMVLVNGSEGIGTGWSTFVPNYNPRDIVTNLKHLLRDEPLEPMDPWYKGFKGTIVKSASKESGVSYTVTGIVEQVNETTIRVLELPIRKWTQDYKEFLEALLCGTEKIKEPSIKDYREHNTDTRVHFEISLSEEKMAEALAEGLTKKFKLSTTISTSNMNLFDKDGHIRKYDTPEQILEDFYHIRLELYVKRKEVQVENLQYELLKLDNKVRFILGVVKGEIVVNNRKRAELLVELKTKGFTPFPKKAKASDLPVVGGDGSDVEADDEEKLNKGVRAGDYEYLLSMPIGTLTLEKVQQLCNERDKLEGDVEELKKCTPKDLWEKDLDNFLEQLTAQEMEEEKEDELELKQMAKEGAAIFKRAAAGRKPAAKAKTADKENAVKPTKKATASTKASNASKKAAKPVELDSEEEYFNTSLQDRLAAYAKGKGPLTEDNSMEDAVKEVSPPTKHNAPKAAPVAKKRANTKASKASKATEDVAAHDSPDAKVRKVRASPFNKKSGSVIPQLAKLSIEAEADSDVEAAPQARPKRRAARPAVHYIESDTEEDKAASEDISDFEDEGSE